MTDPAPHAPPDAGPLAHPTAAALYARARGLLLTPTAEWERIAQEQPTPRQLLLVWVLPLVAVFFLAPQLGAIAFPPKVAGVAAAPSLAGALYTVIVGSALMTGGVWATAWIVDYFAAMFGGRRDPAQALKLAAYSGTGLWLSGLIGLAPPVVLLGAVGIVSVFTLYRGMPVLMHAPADKAVPYTAAVTGAVTVLTVILVSLSSCMAMFAGPEPRPRAAPAPVVVAPPSAAKTDPSGAIDPDKMRRLIPEAIPGGWVRAALTQNAGGALGFTGPTVEAVFENGRERILVRVIDLGAGRAADAIAALRATQPARDDPNALVTHSDADGRYAFETLDRASGAVRRLTVVAGRIALYAEGQSGVTPGQLHEALDLIDMVRVDQIARGL